MCFYYFILFNLDMCVEKFGAQELFCQNMPALNWKAFQLLCRWRRWCICWRQWAWRSCCWRCWTWWGEDHVEDCASLTGCGRESFLQVVQLLRSHQTIFKRSFSQFKFDWFIIWTWPKASSFSMLALAPEQVLQLASIGEAAAASASAIWRKAHFLTFCCFFSVRLVVDNRETKEMETERDQARAHLLLVIVDVCDFYIVAWLRSSLPPTQFFLVILWWGVVFLVENHLNLQMCWDSS